MNDPDKCVHWKKSIKNNVDKLTRNSLNHNDRLDVLEKLLGFLAKESFIYKTHSDRYLGCNTLLKCGNYLVDHVDSVPFKDRKSYFNGIILITHRREFDVQSFEIQYKNGGMAITCNQHILEIMSNYRTFLYKLQAYSNAKLCTKGLYPALLSFCFSITALNYCYIGRITSMVLHCLAPAEEEDDDSPDKVTVLLNKMIEEHTTGRELTPNQISRSTQIFCHLKWAFGEIPKSAEFKKLENTVHQNTSWLNIFYKDHVNRYRFIAELVNYAVYMTHNHTDWSLILGYFDLLLPFLRDMQQDAPNYSKNTIALSKTLLYNTRLFNIYLIITLEATSIHNITATLNTIQRIGEWIACIKNKHNSLHLPSYIHFEIIQNALRILLLENEHYNTLLAALIFIYNHLSCFPPDERDRIISEIFLNNFFRFFLHWNPDVRAVFHHIIVYKVFAFEVSGGSTNTVIGKEPVTQRSLVVDTNNIEAVKDKIKIIKKLMECREKAQCDADYRLLLPYATPSLSSYCEILQSYNDWKSQAYISHDGAIAYPVIKCSTVPEA